MGIYCDGTKKSQGYTQMYGIKKDMHRDKHKAILMALGSAGLALVGAKHYGLVNPSKTAKA